MKALRIFSYDDFIPIQTDGINCIFFANINFYKSDNLIMEIINYLNNAQSVNNGFPQLKIKKQLNKTRSASVLAMPVAEKTASFAISNFFVSLRNIFRSLKKYLWLVAIVFVVCLVPFAVIKIVSLSESHARKVSFDINVDELVVLENQMKSLALNVGNTHDADGNLISSDGIILLPSEINFKEAVKWTDYTVKNGDTVDGITKKFNLKNISTIIGVNKISNVRSLRAGQKIKIPSVDGLLHKVKQNDSLTSLSKKYGVKVEDLLDINDLSSETLVVGSEIFIPGARLASGELRKAMGEIFAYPITAKYRLTSLFGRRADPFTGVPSNHTGIDMACPSGTAVKSAMSGTVIFTGWSNIYGNYVIVKHYDGYQTLYAHLSKITTKKGQSVNQGDRLGLVGSTGYSTGAHLHFSVYKNGKLLDPFSVLK